MTELYHPHDPVLQLQAHEQWVTIDGDVAWPALTVQRRYLCVGMRPEVAELFCDWNETYVTSVRPEHHAIADHGDPRDVESDHVYYVDSWPGVEEPAVARLVWDGEHHYGSHRYDLELDHALPADLTPDLRIWIGANYWMWQRADAPSIGTEAASSGRDVLYVVTTNGSGWVFLEDGAGTELARVDLSDALAEDDLDDAVQHFVIDALRGRQWTQR